MFENAHNTFYRLLPLHQLLRGPNHSSPYTTHASTYHPDSALLTGTWVIFPLLRRVKLAENVDPDPRWHADIIHLKGEFGPIGSSDINIKARLLPTVPFRFISSHITSSQTMRFAFVLAVVATLTASISAHRHHACPEYCKVPADCGGCP
ncbi:uncharacterized protein EDB91DRAFT_1118838 [Suillus paluster]|uniref:uncharacterized protein n=1 Tax=Suillus paluster TaxID=48578 RepID=UPI001B874454|nr:uncharacterized protein EDB91DRAFT_1118838 [Suillus paluster]KAG1746776.1 hypothetical protein EDB91DRAFT_1118838 [Suillus paluster]